MDNKRKNDRFRCAAYCSVIDSSKDKSLGMLVDLSLNGLKIMGEEELCIGTLINLRIEMHKKVLNSRILIIKAKCIWCNLTELRDSYISGFEFENIDEETVERIKIYMQSSVFKKM